MSLMPLRLDKNNQLVDYCSEAGFYSSTHSKGENQNLNDDCISEISEDRRQLIREFKYNLEEE